MPFLPNCFFYFLRFLWVFEYSPIFSDYLLFDCERIWGSSSQTFKPSTLLLYVFISLRLPSWAVGLYKHHHWCHHTTSAVMSRTSTFQLMVSWAVCLAKSKVFWYLLVALYIVYNWRHLPKTHAITTGKRVHLHPHQSNRSPKRIEVEDCPCANQIEDIANTKYQHVARVPPWCPGWPILPLICHHFFYLIGSLVISPDQNR